MKKQQTEAEYIKTYDVNQYDRPSVTVDMLVFAADEAVEENYRKLPEKVLRLLLIRRSENPAQGKWALPGGFVKIDESLDDAAMRRLQEETNVKNVYLEQLYTWGAVDRDPRTRVISVSYMALVDSKALQVQARERVAEAKWFHVTYRLQQEQKTILANGTEIQRWYMLSLVSSDGKDTIQCEIHITQVEDANGTRTTREAIKDGDIAFDHANIIAYGIERLRNKVEYTDIAFHLMPPLFTLTELQQVYEIILDKELLKANFRRKIADRVLETNEYKKDAGHRPSKLFRYCAAEEGRLII